MPRAALRWPDKDPADKLDYSLDWSDQLALTPGDAISAVAFTVPAGLTKESETHADGVAIVWLSGGEAGSDYTVACRITTTGGRIVERSVALSVKEL